MAGQPSPKAVPKRAPSRKPSPKKGPAASETSESIAEQTKAFLKSGKKIEVVESGVSGQPRVTVRK